jgi:hypothetical protein
LRDKSHDLWVWGAFDPATKLIPALQFGPRTQNMAYALLHAVTLVLAPGCLPVFTRDGLDLYFFASRPISVSGSRMGRRANSVGKWRSTCCTARSRNPIAADSLGSSSAEIWLTGVDKAPNRISSPCVIELFFAQGQKGPSGGKQKDPRYCRSCGKQGALFTSNRDLRPFFSGGCGNRTHDTGLMSPLLYQLS